MEQINTHDYISLSHFIAEYIRDRYAFDKSIHHQIFSIKMQ